MGSGDASETAVPVRVNEDIRLVIETADDAICYTNVYYQGEQIGRLNNPLSKPWEELSLVMASQVIIKKSETYDSREELNDLQYEAMLDHRDELDEVFGWPE